MGKTSIVEEYKDKLSEDAKISKILGANLRSLRLESETKDDKRITFPWLANLTALNRISIWRFEKGESGMTVATLVRLKEALGCSWDDLLKGCESKIVKKRKRFAGEVKRKK